MVRLVPVALVLVVLFKELLQDGLLVGLETGGWRKAGRGVRGGKEGREEEGGGKRKEKNSKREGGGGR